MPLRPTDATAGGCKPGGRFLVTATRRLRGQRVRGRAQKRLERGVISRLPGSWRRAECPT